ncbi:4'-phosphopantetheinyl transferase [Gemmobacter lanyuensis]
MAKRQSEFRAGRHAARAALAELGLPDRPIPAGADRAPIWPLGLIGSISHSDRLCLAAVGRGRGIGVDLEPAEPLEPQIHRMILSPEDRGSEGAVISGLETRLIFSAKEAAYKAQYPLSRQLFDFQTLAVTVQGIASKRASAVTLPHLPRSLCCKAAGRRWRGISSVSWRSDLFESGRSRYTKACDRP